MLVTSQGSGPSTARGVDRARTTGSLSCVPSRSPGWIYGRRVAVVIVPIGVAPLVVASSSADTGSVIVLVGTILAFIGALIMAVISGRRIASVPVWRRQDVRASSRDASDVDLPLPEPEPEPAAVRVLEVLLLLALAGYVFFDRAFAWIHVPGTPLFVGEIIIAIGVFVLLGMHTRIGDIVQASSAIKVMLLLMAWGAVLLVIALPTWGEDAVRDAAVWYYGIIAVFVVVMITSDPHRIGRWLRLFGRLIPWMLVWFPFAIILDAAFYESFPSVPDSKISIVAHRTGNVAVMAAVALGFLWLVDRDSEIFSRRQRLVLTVLATVVILFAAMRNRGGFLAGALALFIVFLFLRRERSSMAGIMVGVAVVLLAVGLFGSVRVKLFAEREVSVDQLMDNLVSVVDTSSGGQRQESTTKWRLAIWQAVLDDVTNDYPIAGFGPGPDLGERYNIAGQADEPLRNPHNSHVGVLARMGFVGVALWAIFWIAWFGEMVALRRRLIMRGRLGQAGVAGWLVISCVAILVNAIFDPALEGPQVSWWMWGFVGFGIAMAVLDRWNRLPALRLTAQSSDRRPSVVAAP